MDEITVQAPAKLNLTLDVLGRREDGYHDLKMVMQSITLADRLTLRPGQTPGIQVSSSFHFLPTGEKNLAGKAAVCFYQALGRPARDLDIAITKHVPVCAGMAGGSSDAAAVLRALNQLEGSPFSPEELAHVGEGVGSDVPYCVLGCTALAQGRGEVLTPLSPLPHCWVVACKPDFPVSTPELFARIDSCRIRRRPDADGDGRFRAGGPDGGGPADVQRVRGRAPRAAVCPGGRHQKHPDPAGRSGGQHERHRPHRLRPVCQPDPGPSRLRRSEAALSRGFSGRDRLIFPLSAHTVSKLLTVWAVFCRREEFLWTVN